MRRGPKAALILLAIVVVLSIAQFILAPRGAIPGVPHSGDRRDAPRLEERGNGVFTDAAYDDTGTLLVTATNFGSAPMLVWDATNGNIISALEASVPKPGTKAIWMIDSRRRRLFAHTAKDGYALYDLMTGAIISTFPDPPGRNSDPFAVGLTSNGRQALVFTPGFMELWNLDAPGVARREPSPFTGKDHTPYCVGGIPATYNDKRCWEWSADRRTLAVAVTPREPPRSPTEYLLIDTATLQIERLEPPAETRKQSFASFAFSRDNRWLAVGMSEELWLYDRTAREWVRSIPGDHKRNRRVGPMRFTADSNRVIALEDQLQISVYDANSGQRLGRHVPTADNWEGVFKVSDDGSRVLVYKFSTDTFEVLDGNTAGRLGWVCPYYCNARHNPVAVPYAVSPDGTSAAISHRRGAAVWNTATDTIRFPLKDPKRKPLPYPADP